MHAYNHVVCISTYKSVCLQVNVLFCLWDVFAEWFLYVFIDVWAVKWKLVPLNIIMQVVHSWCRYGSTGFLNCVLLPMHVHGTACMNVSPCKVKVDWTHSFFFLRRDRRRRHHMSMWEPRSSQLYVCQMVACCAWLWTSVTTCIFVCSTVCIGRAYI